MPNTAANIKKLLGSTGIPIDISGCQSSEQWPRRDPRLTNSNSEIVPDEYQRQVGGEMRRDTRLINDRFPLPDEAYASSPDRSARLPTASSRLTFQVTPATNIDAGVWYTSDGNDTSNHSIMAATGLTYNLSKATALYSQVGYVYNHGLMNTGLSTNGALFGVAGSTVGVAAGIRHMF